MTDLAIDTQSPIEALDALARKARSLQVGSVRVEEASAALGRDGDDAVAVFLRLVLTNPVGDRWSSTDMLTLHRELADAADRLKLHWPLYLRFDPVSDDPPAEDDELPLPAE